MSIFLISDDGEARIKAYDATTKGNTTLLRVTVEITDAYALAHMLESLAKLKLAQENRDRLAKAHKAPRRPTTHHAKVAAQRLLALPPPDDEPLDPI